YTAAKSRKFVPEDFLFRTGGAQTVRGYSYLELGVREGNAVVGGRYMAVGSVEYTHWLEASKWGIATFVDAGNATDQLQGFRFKIGTGFGVRWKSPAGPLAFDLAYGVDDKRVRPHISIAIAF
ncbi:MAG TPA: BamA/TamA family outer membrane protein, partial [Rhodocyclaceae bacterium]|nr:BamA/TamA family outer membrane protein [Rhodocyclaceae bacterium]